MKKSGMKGFTLVELMVAVAVIAVLTGFVSIGKGIMYREQVSSATRELLADLQRARVFAMTKDSMGYGIRFESPNSYTVFRFKDCNNDYSYDPAACPENAREEADVIKRTMPASVALKKNNPGDDFTNDVLMFDRFGVPRGESWKMGWMTIVVQSEYDAENVKCVSVSTNRIREGKWGWSRKDRRNTCIES